MRKLTVDLDVELSRDWPANRATKKTCACPCANIKVKCDGSSLALGGPSSSLKQFSWISGLLAVSLVPKPRYFRPAATNSLDFRIAGGSLDVRVAGG